MAATVARALAVRGLRERPEYRSSHEQTEYWRDDLVTFMMGCSFTFEDALLNNGIHMTHNDQNVNFPMYRTNRRCDPAGSLSGPLGV